jgi:CLIP-associating protein 1/2
LAREGAIIRVRGMLKGEAHLRYTDVFLACLKDSFIQWSLKAVSPRIQLISALNDALFVLLARQLEDDSSSKYDLPLL